MTDYDYNKKINEAKNKLKAILDARTKCKGECNNCIYESKEADTGIFMCSFDNGKHTIVCLCKDISRTTEGIYQGVINDIKDNLETEISDIANSYDCYPNLTYKEFKTAKDREAYLNHNEV